MLELVGVTHIYPNGTRALDDVTLSVPKGMFGLLGPNGAGKSTLMRSVATLQTPTSGSIRFGDIDIIAQPELLRERLGYLPQDFGVYPRVSAYDMLDHMAVLKGVASARERKETVETLLNQTNLWTVRKKAIAGFSGGMRQRFGIAQALIGNPELIIVDEPTAGLDPEERNRFLNLLAEIGENVVVILSTHIVDDVADLCPRMAVLAAGKIQLEGAPLDLIKQSRGTVWAKTIDRDKLEDHRTRFEVISTRLFAGRTIVHILSPSDPGDGFIAVDGGLEDVYFSTLARTRRPSRRRRSLSPDMFGKIARFELRYQLRNPVFWVVAILFFLLTFGSVTIQQIQIGSGGNIHKNAPMAIAQTSLIFSLFYMFVTTAFVANVIVRDDESGFGPMVKSTRVSKFDYLLARFLGAFLVAAISFLAVPLAIWFGSLMPWVNSETLGPTYWHAYFFAYFAMALPNLFLTSAIFFAVATMTRSMMYSYVGVVVFLVGYIVFNAVIRTRPELRDLVGYIEPFEFAAYGSLARYWTAAEANTLVPAFSGVILWNRLIWFGISLLALAFAYSRFSFAERGLSKRRAAKQARREGKRAAAAPLLVDRLPPARPAQAGFTQLRARCAFEMRMVFRSPAFFILMALGIANSVAGLLLSNDLYGTPARPLTFATIGVLEGAFTLFVYIIAIYYSGELVWRDRERKFHEIIDATALPNWAYMVPKTLAVTGVLFSTFVAAMLTGIVVQLARGVTDLHIGQYVVWYLLPQTVDAVILAVLAVFVQALSPNKYVGWAIMVVYIVAQLTLSNIGFDHPLYNYGASGGTQLSDMNGNQIGGAAGWWLRLYWGAFALILATLAHLLWRRGTETGIKPRLARLPHRLASRPGALMAAALLVFVATGGFLYWNMDILNVYRTTDDYDRMRADYEKKYLKYEKVLQPSTTDITLNVALYPAERRAETSGTYRFVNDTGAPLSDLHVRLQDYDTKILAIDVPGTTLAMNDAVLQYRIYHFTTPLAPGATGTLTFRTERWQRGLRANDDDTSLVGNGTFLNNGALAPQIGMSRDGLLGDPIKRRKYGLPSELRPAKLEDVSAQRRNYVGDADWVHSDITLSTDAGQVPIAPGRKVSDTIANGRRVAHFVSGPAPILAFFSLQSAAYAEKSAMADGVKLSVYYDPKHSYNVDRMLAAMKTSLGYYRANFGPYQFDYARIIEFPGYATFAQAFAGTIPYSERIGFIADTRDPDKIDYVTYVTAHELGHQYWAHQIISADMQGGTILVETMAQYSALMVMKHMYGEDKIRRFLKYELDSYLRARGGERIEELPLDRVENQPYIHYRKGAVVMYLLQDRLGEDRVNAMLRQLLDKYRFKSQPYPRSLDLENGFLSLARTPAERELVLDLLARITIYDLKAKTASVRKLPDGTFETTIAIDAAKFYASGTGVEKAVPLVDDIEVGLFDQRPGLGAFAAKDVISMQRVAIKSGSQAIRVISKRKPAFAGIDPYNKYIDRNSDDNLIPVRG